MNKSETIGELAAALSKFQGECQAPKKAKKSHHGTYADLGGYIETASPVLSKHELAVTQLLDNDCAGQPTVETILTHSSGEWLSSMVNIPDEANGRVTGAQKAGIGITYMRRYAYAAILGLAAEDNDGNENLISLKDENVSARIEQLKAEGHSGAQIVKSLKASNFKLSANQTREILGAE
tara:strand:+ start:6850 stop:7389 length:540 start_codon:yes stop_codon:yes gene_type:complete